MLYGLALQIARPLGSASDVAAHQTILVPAAGVSWSRYITTDHPRRTWRQGFYSLASRDLFGTTDVRPSLAAPFDDRASAKWHLTTDVPVLFHVKDDEYAELAAGTMPRNVALRAARALEAHEANLIGSGAHTLGAATARLDEKIATNAATLAKAPRGDGTVGARLDAVLSAVDEKIREDRTAMLEQYVPKVARAKGAGAHRTHDNLPSVSAPTAEPTPTPTPTTPAPTATAGDPKPGDVLIRPNGVQHVCRAVEGEIKNLSEVGLFRRVARRGVHILLSGQPGTGKTAGLEVAFPENGGLRTMILTPRTEADDFYGSYVSVVGEDGRETLVWEDSELVKAMENGAKILLDEIGLAPANELSPLFPLMDGRRELRIPTNPARGVVKAKDGFGIVAAYNPDSSRNISEALVSRFRLKMEVTTDYAVARSLGVNPRMVDAAEHMEAQRRTGDMGWAPQMRELLAFKDDEADLGIVLALRNLVMDAPEFEREVVEGHLRERFGDIPGAARKIKALGI